MFEVHTQILMLTRSCCAQQEEYDRYLQDVRDLERLGLMGPGTSASAPPGITLLGLPEEARQRIFTFALRQEDVIEISQHLKPPALLATCSQIRDEASKLWLAKNTFIIHIHHFDARLLVAWNKLTNGYVKSTSF